MIEDNEYTPVEKQMTYGEIMENERKNAETIAKRETINNIGYED